jgi:hypothetical protein
MHDAGEERFLVSKYILKSISWAQAQEFQYQLLKNSGVKNGPSATDRQYK